MDHNKKDNQQTMASKSAANKAAADRATEKAIAARENGGTGAKLVRKAQDQAKAAEKNSR
jgi:hypothetical protein